MPQQNKASEALAAATAAAKAGADSPVALLQKIIEEGQARILASGAESRASLMEMWGQPSTPELDNEGIDPDIAAGYNNSAGHSETQTLLMLFQINRRLYRLESVSKAFLELLLPPPEAATTDDADKNT